MIAEPKPNSSCLVGQFGCCAFTSLNPIDFKLSLQHSAGSTEYFFRETIVNNSGFTWSGFKLQIGVATGSDFPGIAVSEVVRPNFDFQNFDPRPSNTAFASFQWLGFDLSWFDGLLLNGDAATITFSVDTPEDSPNPPLQLPSFVLRELPIAIPEPTTWALSTVPLWLSFFPSQSAF